LSDVAQTVVEMSSATSIPAQSELGAQLRPGRPLRLLFLTQTYPRYDTDIAGPFIRDLAKGLVRLGDSVTVLAPHSAGMKAAWEEDGVTVSTFRYAPERLEVLGYGRSLERDESIKLAAGLVTPLYLWAARRAVARRVRAEPFDLVQAHWVVPNAVALLGLLPAVSTGDERRRILPSLAIGLHGSDVFLAERPLVDRWVARVLRSTAVLTGCSPELVRRVEALAKSPVYSQVIPYGVDTRIFAPGDDTTGWREKLGIPPSAPLLLSVGRLASKKGFDVLVEVLPTLLARHPELHVVLAGSGDLLEELRRATEKDRARVHLPGRVERDVLPDLYRAADCFVLPAVHDRRGNVDGLPNVILEAMASGLPVVASDISGIPLAVVPESTGLLVPERDPAALLGALDRLLSDQELRRNWGARSRVRAEAELTWDAVAARYHHAYVEGLDRVEQKRLKPE
jgi:glycosyltransferase involved in cell wall biosynthesis